MTIIIVRQSYIARYKVKVERYNIAVVKNEIAIIMRYSHDKIDFDIKSLWGLKFRITRKQIHNYEI